MPSTHDGLHDHGQHDNGPLRRALIITSLLAGTLSAMPTTAAAQSVRMLVQSSPLAGFRYHEAPRWFGDLRSGDALTLRREPDNPHDANAVRVEWQGRMLGYVPRAQNATLAWAMDRGDPVSGRISRVREHRNPRQRVEFEVFVD
jgi:hypothetical protein